MNFGVTYSNDLILTLHHEFVLVSLSLAQFADLSSAKHSGGRVQGKPVVPRGAEELVCELGAGAPGRLSGAERTSETEVFVRCPCAVGGPWGYR